jgi:hypothetical protein
MKAADTASTFALDSESIAAVVAEFEGFIPACWHASRAPAVRVLAGNVRLQSLRNGHFP